MRDKKAYDREYQRQRAVRVYADFHKRRLELFKVFGNECYLCGRPAIKGFHLHHTEYHPVESNYKRDSRSMSTRIKRLKEAEAHPERFALLCPHDHRLVEFCKGMGFASIKIDRLLKLI